MENEVFGFNGKKYGITKENVNDKIELVIEIVKRECGRQADPFTIKCSEDGIVKGFLEDLKNYHCK